MPWKGPEPDGDAFPTLGHLVCEWISEYLVIPDGPRRGEPFVPTDEQYRHMLHNYRLHPHATVEMGSQAFRYYGSLLVRPQKAGKDPLAGAEACVQALGPVRFDGWDAYGNPVGAPMPTPWIQCAANSEEQTSNTFRMIYGQLSEGPCANIPGLDVGLTRVSLPDGGRIEPVTANARSRLGQRITYAVMTESGLYTETSGGVAMARTIKRGLAGMDGRWIEITNAWDPTENSTAQRTYEAQAPGVYVNYRPPRSHVDMDDDFALRQELLYVYGDAARERGGWVNIDRIMEEIRDPATGEGEGRRFFLNEIWVGSKDAIDALKWAGQAKRDDPLEPGEKVCLGFHGSQTQDATSLVASRLRDGRLFHLRTWQKPAHTPNAQWAIPRDEVDVAVKDAFKAYEVIAMFCSPATWQTETNAWAGEFNEPDKFREGPTQRVLELWLNSEMRVDQMVERFQTAHRGNEITHDGDATLTDHAKAAALTNGRKRSTAEEKDSNLPEHYQRVVKKSWGESISAFIAALLAYEARGWAIEHGALVVEEGPPNLW